MSEMTNTPSGRTQAIARRKSRASGNVPAIPTRAQSASSAPVQVQSASSAPRQEVVEPSIRRPVRPSHPVSVAGGREAAKKRRKQMMNGQAVSNQPQPKAKGREKKTPEPIVEPRAKIETKAKSKRADTSGRRNPVNTANIADNSGRKMSKAWRKALAKGKLGADAYKSKTGHSGSIAKMTNPDASTREIARSVRAERCSKGKTNCAATTETSKKRQSSRSRSNDLPEKVGFSETLSGQSVSGIEVGQGSLTGAETGACQLVSGTEYLGIEEFKSHCSDSPKAAPSKVTTTQTTKGQTISGNKMGQAKSVTGDRAGQCSGVTGTDYLPADQSDILCASKSGHAGAQNGGFTINPGPSPQTNSSGTNSLDGSDRKVSGGNDYPAMSGSIQPSSTPTNEVPKKVVMSTTLAGNATTGTQVGRPQDVTGGESGYCKNVTGTGYQGKEEVETVCHASVPTNTPGKVNVSGTFGGQKVTGDRSGGNSNITGGEAGRCKSVSGSPYMGKESFESSCSVEEQTMVQKKTQPSGRQHGYPLTGIQPGPQGLTGAQKGACELVSGTHYQGADQAGALCLSSQAASPGESDFPMMMGQATPVDMSQPFPSVEPAPKSSSITGDGWDKGNKVTGIDGPFAAQRNPSIRGMQGQTPMSAANFRPIAMEEVPQSPITGSSGNTGQGSKVTLSGGARA
jgi:hypothetical protein